MRLAWILVCALVQSVFGIIEWRNAMTDFKLDEQLPPGTYVDKLSAIDTTTGSDDGIFYGFSYQVPGGDELTLESVEDTSSIFKIDRVSGEVFTHGTVLDYESQEVNKEFTQYFIAVNALTGEFNRRTSQITLNNINDNAPSFSDTENIFINESTVVPPDGLLLFEDFRASDPDLITTTQFELLDMEIESCRYPTTNTSDDCEGKFKLVQVKRNNEEFIVDIYLIGSLDHEKHDVINIVLMATDGELTSRKDVVVTVRNEQDRDPIWTLLPKNTATDEHNSAFNVVVRAEDGDNLERPVYYSLRNGSESQGIPVERVFQIDPFTGVITNIIELDLEDTQVFRNYESQIERTNWELILQACEYTSKVPLVLTNQCASEENITITINDINDNAPLHKHRIYEFNLDENEPNGRGLEKSRSGGVIEIFDADTDRFNTYITEFINASAEFQIDGRVSNPTISIKNTSLIDMDKSPIVYTLHLRTYDVADRSLSSTATVSIFIQDRNDLVPYFPVDLYTGQVVENAQAGDDIITVTAFDNDYDQEKHGNKSIEYKLLGGYVELFEIGKETGLIKVKRCPYDPTGRHGVDPCIDYDVEPRVYDMLVQAADNRNGQNANFATVKVRIQVLKVNDNAPTVLNYTRDINENRTTFQPALIVEGVDKDDVDGVSSLSYSILTQTPGKFWKINATSGEITVDKPNNAGIKFSDAGNKEGRFFLEVAVTDGLYRAISYVTITVLDQNDNAPIFQNLNYTFSISELTPGNRSIYQIQAEDEDDPTTLNGQLQYSMFSGNRGGKFALDLITGDIFTTVGATFDYDTQDVYQFVALVVDLGTPQLQGFANVTINIIDQNNKNPQITPSLQPFNISESAKPNTIVGQIKAKDLDANARLEFEFIEPMQAFNKDGQELLSNNYDYRILFYVERDTGVIRVNQTKLNYELTRDLNFDIMVTDVSAAEPQVGKGTVTIEVLPYNEIAPEFEVYVTPLFLPEELPVGSIITSLIARDNNGIKEYKLIRQPDNFFRVTANTGSVNILNTVDYDGGKLTNDSYFVIEAIDTGIPVLSSSASVSVIFYNINDEYPYFVDPYDVDTLQDIYFGSIKENSPDGTPVTLVKALDNDRPDDQGFHLVRYSMEDSRFQVDAETGNVTVRLKDGFKLDREQNSRVFTFVLARDNPGDPNNQNQAAATIQVTLEDVNDNPPIFSEDEYEVTIFETISVQTEILSVFIYDLDLGINAISLFTKLPQPNYEFDDLFGVRNESGKVYVAKELRGYARRAPYVLYVQAQDEKGFGFKSSVKVSVYVKESANGPPRFLRPPRTNMTIYVLESQYNGMLVYDVKAVDDDTGTNGLLDYSFIYEGQTSQTTPEFEINRVNGMIHAQIVYDREAVDRYVLLLKATDRGQTPLEATRFLTIVVKDVNDNAPIFPTNELEFRVPEDAPKEYFIGQVQATDADLNPIIIYEIIGGNEDGVFALNPFTGILTLSDTLDSEIKNVYFLDIQARNEEPDYTVIRSRRRRAIDPSIITVKVLVGDINDLAPVFLLNEYYGCVSTRSPYDKHIMTVQARDDDAAGSGIVRYSIMKGNKDGDRTLFDIHEKFGVISNKALMRDYVDGVYELTINARDAENPEDSESANITTRVFVTMPGREVKLTITQNTREVRLYQTQIQSIIEEAADLDYLCINEIEDHVTEGRGASRTLWSDVYVSGARRESNGAITIVSGVELRNIITREISNRKKDFDLLYIRDVELASSSDEIRLEDKAVLIILIIIAVLIFLVIIFCIVAFMCIRAAESGEGLCQCCMGDDEEGKQQKKQILVHKTHATPAPIMVVQREPEPVVYDNRQYVQEVQVRDPQLEPEHEPVVVSTFQEERVYEPETVHVQYAKVQKRTPSPEYEDDQDAIVVELKDDRPTGPDVYEADYEPEPEYRIEAEVE